MVHLLVLLIPGLEPLAVAEKGLVGQLVLVLKLDPVPGFMKFDGMLEDHDFNLLGFEVREFALVDEGSNAGV